MEPVTQIKTGDRFSIEGDRAGVMTATSDSMSYLEGRVLMLIVNAESDYGVRLTRERIQADRIIMGEVTKT